MDEREPVCWGILGTANIARSAFLPAVRAAGGVPFMVGGRDLEKTRQYATDNGIANGVEGYERVLADERIDAVYIPLPNSLHAEWTIEALRAEKAVLCEKPLTAMLGETEKVLAVAHERAGLLWEAFVFPFREQTHRLEQIIHSGEIGELVEIQTTWYFPLRQTSNIRLSSALGGGALFDVGCYCIRFARLLFQSDADRALATARWTDDGVDVEMAGVLSFPGDRRLLFSCGMNRRQDTFARVIGTEGEIQLSNPYHPSPGDRMTLRGPDGNEIDRSTPNDGPSFTAAIQHIHRVLWGEESPRHLAADDSLGNAGALDLIERSARSGSAQGI